VREIHEACEGWGELGPRVAALAAPIAARLSLTPADRHAPWEPPVKTSLEAFVATGGFVFLGLHGGIGEDGRLQAMLAGAGAHHNGSGARASALCIDKKATGEALTALAIPGLMSLSKEVHEVGALRRSDLAATWAGLVARLGGPSLIAKPVGDGCSAGVCRLDSAAHLSLYLLLAAAGARCIPEGALRPGEPAVAMPDGLEQVLFERFIETDRISVEGGALAWEPRGGWIEVTAGVLGPRGALRALTPSITVAEGVVLSLEENFQGGTGVNITPPPASHVSPAALATGREHLRRTAVALGIEGYARLDAFLHRETGEIIVIEANTLPGLSPSTVLFHQGLAEQPPLFPRDLLETIIDLGW
jgi:D-alanine-D-alanine ligase-like ATP-grasp enzyme